MGNENYEKIKARLESDSLKEMIEGSLPSSIDATSWINSALTHVGSDKDLLIATPTSTIAAILEAATLGVRFEGPLGEAYLEARNNKKKDERGKEYWEKITQLQVQYRGLMKLARRDPSVRKIEAIIVHEHDYFKHQLGTNLFLDHTWDVRQPRGKMVAVYAAIRYHDGFYDFGQPYPIEAVYNHRNNVLADKNIRVEIAKDGTEIFWKRWKNDEPEKVLSPASMRRTPWITYFPAMAQKTAIRWSAKFWELSPDFERAAGLVSLAESGHQQDLEKRFERLLAEREAQGEGDGDMKKEAAAQGVQNVSLATMHGLREQMLAETGVTGQGAMEGPPEEQGNEGAENAESGPEPEDQSSKEQEPESKEPTPEEQEEIRERELQEAAEFQREQKQGSAKGTGRKGSGKKGR